MKKYRITFFLYPVAENISITIWARNYEEACVFAREYREETFTVVEI